MTDLIDDFKPVPLFYKKYYANRQRDVCVKNNGGLSKIRLQKLNGKMMYRLIHPHTQKVYPLTPEQIYKWVFDGIGPRIPGLDLYSVNSEGHNIDKWLNSMWRPQR